MPKVNLFGDTGESWTDKISMSESINMVPFVSKTKNALVFSKMPGTTGLYASGTETDEIMGVFPIHSQNSLFEDRIYFVKKVLGGNSEVWNLDQAGTATQIATSGDASVLAQACTYPLFALNEAQHGGKLLIAGFNSASFVEITLNDTAASDTAANNAGVTNWIIKSIDYFDGYFFASISDSGTNNERRKIISTGFDDTTFTALNFGLITSKSDNLVQVINDRRELWAFCETHIEIWYHAGSSGFPLLRNPSVYIDFGVLTERTLVDFGNSFIFLGVSQAGDVGIYQTEGYGIVDITPERLRYLLMSQNTTGVDKSRAANARSVFLAQYKLYVINFLDSTLGTWVFNLRSGLWSKEESNGISFSKYGKGYCNAIMNAGSGSTDHFNVVIPYSSISGWVVTNLNELHYYDDSSNLEALNFDTPTTEVKELTLVSNYIIGKDDDEVIHKKLKIKTTKQNNPSSSLTLSYTDDEGASWTSLGSHSISAGVIEIFSLGSAEKRAYKLEGTISGNSSTAPFNIFDSYIEIEQLNS